MMKMALTAITQLKVCGAGPSTSHKKRAIRTPTHSESKMGLANCYTAKCSSGESMSVLVTGLCAILPEASRASKATLMAQMCI